MRTSKTISLAALASLSSAQTFPITQCGQYDTTTVGPYVVENNLWNMYAGTGSQCYTVNGLSGIDLSWSTNWTWSNGINQVKSYANTNYPITPVQLSSITSIPSVWDWTYSTYDITADVAYDMFTSSSPTGSQEYEIMIWLADLGGAHPISDSYNSAGEPNPIATDLSIGSNTFDLYGGKNGETGSYVYSFVASSTIYNFDGDVNGFLQNLVSGQGFSEAQYLLSIQAGTEAFDGGVATLTTTKYNVQVES